jgi:tRNA U34 5-methylaminomethyl-2-thiouridine-forming methyltransferase MnmC
MKRTLVQTEDGASTFFIEALDEHYHSIYGAIQEAQVVFINARLKYFEYQPEIKILEIGFGTGLNALMTFNYNQGHQNIIYHSVEKYPITLEEMKCLNYTEQLQNQVLQPVFQKMHECNWNELVEIESNFHLKKILDTIEGFQPEPNFFDIVYFDAFAPAAQPQLWSEAIFEKMFAALKSGGILVTYCAKGSVKRAMKAAGFKIEALPGPKNKREMTRAIKV